MKRVNTRIQTMISNCFNYSNDKEKDFCDNSRPSSPIRVFPATKLISTKMPPRKPPKCPSTPSLVPVSEPIPVSSPIPAPVSKTVSATNLTKAKNLPYTILCCMCQKMSKGYTFMCLQCDYKACTECDDVANHNQHYVLRIPTRANMEEIEAVVTKIEELVGSGTLLAADIKAKTKKVKRRAPVQRKINTNKKMWVDTTLEPRPKRSRKGNQNTPIKPTVPKPANTEKTKVNRNIQNKYTVHVHKNKENSQIPRREIAERIEIRNDKDFNCENESNLSLNIKQESGLAEEEVYTVPTVKDEIDDPLESVEDYLDATVPLSTVMPSSLPISQPPIRVHEPTASTSRLHQPSNYMSDDDDTDSADEVYI